METQEIIEGNKLIAEFMGATKYSGSTNGDKYLFYSFMNGDIKPYSDFSDEFVWGFGCPLDTELKFNSSWEWLMPVVEKIGNITEFKTIAECSDEEWFITTKLTKRTITTPLRYIWCDVIDFINWYNKNN